MINLLCRIWRSWKLCKIKAKREWERDWEGRQW